MIKQRTNEWYRARIGKFTASNFGKLMSKPADKNAEWSKTALSLIEKAAAQLYYNDYYEKPDFEATGWGNLYEPEAIKELQALLNCETEEGGFITDNQIRQAGATPDLYLLSQEDVYIAQIKCPFNQENHIKYRTKIKDATSLRKIKSEYFWQIQGELWITKLQKCYFVSFDPRLEGENRLHYAIIERDEEAIEILKRQILKSIEKRNEFHRSFVLQLAYPKPLAEYW
jgi:exodeoxyribonuclease (lambda-induced)